MNLKPVSDEKCMNAQGNIPIGSGPGLVKANSWSLLSDTGLTVTFTDNIFEGSYAKTLLAL